MIQVSQAVESAMGSVLPRGVWFNDQFTHSGLKLACQCTLEPTSMHIAHPIKCSPQYNYQSPTIASKVFGV